MKIKTRHHYAPFIACSGFIESMQSSAREPVKHRISKPKEDVRKLYKKLMGCPGVPTVSMVKEILDTAKILLAPRLIGMNLTNAALDPAVRDLLIESISFSLGKERSISLSTRNLLIEYHGEDEKVFPEPDEFEVPDCLEDFFGPKHEKNTLLFDWINQKNGLYDLVATMHLIYVGNI